MIFRPKLYISILLILIVVSIGVSGYMLLSSDSFIDSLYTQALIHLGVGDIPLELTDIRIYPNPVSESAQLAYTLDQPALVHVEILNSIGSTAWQTNAGKQNPGNHTLHLPIRHLASGIYLCRLQVGEQSVVKRIIKL